MRRLPLVLCLWWSQRPRSSALCSRYHYCHCRVPSAHLLPLAVMGQGLDGMGRIAAAGSCAGCLGLAYEAQCRWGPWRVLCHPGAAGMLGATRTLYVRNSRWAELCAASLANTMPHRANLLSNRQSADVGLTSTLSPAGRFPSPLCISHQSRLFHSLVRLLIISIPLALMTRSRTVVLCCSHGSHPSHLCRWGRC